MGHRTNFLGAWSGDAFFIAAVLYVDDPDLLHMSDIPTTDEDFLAGVQHATSDWGGLVQAAGGSLKPSKFYWYLMSWMWKKGEPTMKPFSKLPTTKLTTPQPYGSQVAIPLKDVGHSKKSWVFSAVHQVTLECI